MFILFFVNTNLRFFYCFAKKKTETNTSIVISPPPPSTDIYPCNSGHIQPTSAKVPSSKPRSRQKGNNRFFLDSSHRERTNLGICQNNAFIKSIFYYINKI